MPAGAVRGTYAIGAAPLIALTHDERLLGTLRAVTEPAHPVRVAGSEIDFAQALMAQHAGVAVLDCAAVATPIAQLAGRLHGQFPDLVLIVAGGAEEQGVLTNHITDGTVHRFLHKPVSEQRVRLFVESAWRRHLEGARAPRTDAAPPQRPPRLRLVLSALAVVALAVAAGWFALRNGSSAPHSGAPGAQTAAAAAHDPALEDLLERADRALGAGALIAPPQENAAALYREALRHNARDPRAVNGLEQVIDRLVTDAEAQLADHHLDAAQQLADAARAIMPDHPRVAFLTAQIGAQRERAVLGRAQRAAAGGDVGAALAVLDDAARGGHHSTLVDEARVQLAQKQVDERVQDYLGRAQEALNSGALIEPPEQNAHFYLESAHALAPADPAVQQARAQLATRLLADARQAVLGGNADQAERLATAAQESGADPGELGTVLGSVQQLRGNVRADAVAHTESLFNQRLAQGRLLEPANDSARYYLEQLAQAEPAGASTLAARTAFENRLIEEVHAAVRAQDVNAARRWLAEAQAAGASPSALAAAEAEIGAPQSPPRAEAAAPAPAPVAAPPAAAPEAAAVDASTLTRTRYSAPQYPDTARTRGIEGWVDVQFLVNVDGSVSEAAIVGAQPVGVFEQSALEAVRHWRYQPVLRDGAAVSQRARVRVRFTVQS